MLSIYLSLSHIAMATSADIKMPEMGGFVIAGHLATDSLDGSAGSSVCWSPSA